MQFIAGWQLEGLFLSSLLLQIQKVNSFYCDKAQELSGHLDQCALLHSLQNNWILSACDPVISSFAGSGLALL